MEGKGFREVLKTTHGKFSVGFAVVAVVFLIAGLAAGIETKTCVLLFALGLALAVMFYFQGNRTTVDVPFSPDKTVRRYLFVDSVNRKWSAPMSKEQGENPYDFADVQSYALVEDGRVLMSGSTGRPTGTSRALPTWMQSATSFR